MSKLGSPYRLSMIAMQLAVTLFFASSANAQSKCANLFTDRVGKIEVNAMGEGDEGKRIAEDAQIIAQLAYELGLETPPHQLNIVPSGQLDTLAGTGGHPAPHWTDGNEVVQASSKPSGVLEFVTKGCPTCRSYYSASTPHEEQRSVIMHVAGHNDVSSTSRYYTIRPSDAPLASAHLANAVANAYSRHNHDEVSLYFQYLKSFTSMQDYTNGTFEDPSTFSAKSNAAPFKDGEAKSFWEALPTVEGGFFANLLPTKKPRGPEGRGGWTKTYSVIQAMTEMLPQDATQWQRTLFKLNEQSHRAYPATFQAKILNEGWATLMMYVMARHLPWTTSADLVKYGQLLSGVLRPDFSNPYWLGTSGWMNLYEQYMERPELKGLTEKEKDRRFIKYARELYADKNDSAWAKVALDERWIEKNRFFLYRETTQDEIDFNADPEKQKFIALTRDWKRIRNFVIAKYVDAKYNSIPSLMILNPNHTQGQISLVQDKARGLPLEITSAAKTMFVIAQVLQKPVHLDALFERMIFEDDSQVAGPFGPRQPSTKSLTVNGKMTVAVNGKVSLEVEEKTHEEDAKQLEEIIDAYKANVLASFKGEMTDYNMRQWEKLQAQVSDVSAEPVNRIVQFAPHTGPAVREYLQVIEQRLRGAIEDALKGRTPSKISGSGITLPVLPEIPEFRYARATIERKIGMKPVGPVDYPGQIAKHDFHVDQNGSRIGQGPQLPGDKWSPKKKQQQEQGEGEGEGDGDGDGQPGKGKGKPKPGEGDPDGEEPSPGSGSGTGNPSDIKIPLKLYGELLGEILELPNVRRTNGRDPQMQQIRRGSVAKTAGYVLWDQSVMVAVEKVRALRRAKGLPYDASVPLGDLIREALPLMEPGDIRVAGHMEKPLPDMEAVLVVNLDMTGSMSGDRFENAMNLIYNVEALLKAKYKNVTIVYVGFDSVAKELKRDQFYSQFWGGGTNYASAAKLDREILSDERFPLSKYSHYIMTIGDAETSPQDAQAYVHEISEMKDRLQYAGIAITNESLEGMVAPMVQEHKKLKFDWPWIGLAQLRGPQDMFKAIKDLFLGDKEEQ
jgi:uncharacterized sporulation protein YeaH/YhbH (DUF444 family)/spore cortex formation protein SpoVR/YcgB (stage V sporulation)